MIVSPSVTKTAALVKKFSTASGRCLLSLIVVGMCLSFGTTAMASGGDKNKVCLDDCPCSDGVSFLRLTYTGPSGSTVRAENSGVIFNSVLNTGDLFELNGTQGDGGFSSNTLSLFIDNVKDVDIHVSCSQPIGVGFVFGTFTVEAMASVDGGMFDTPCPYDCPCDGNEVDLSRFGQGGDSCTSNPRPVATDGSPASFVMSARTQVDKNSPLDPTALGSPGKVVINKDGTGVKRASCSGGKGIAGKGGDRDEELTFTFDSSILADSIQIHLNKADFQNDGDDDARLLIPNASAGQDQAVASQAIVGLDGSASAAQLGGLTYSWTQLTGPAVTLSDPTAVQPTFVAPVISQPTPINFQLTVSDGQNTHSDIVQVNVNLLNAPNTVPSAAAGADIATLELLPILLDATNSFDTDGDLLTYTWEQVSGTPVVLVDANTAKAKFLAPDLVDDETLKFRVTVSDGQTTSSDTVLAATSSAPDEPVIYISSTSSAGFDYTITTAEIVAAFSSDGENRGWVDFSQFTSLPSGLMIDAFAIRETNDDLYVDFYLDCTPDCTTDAECSDNDACNGVETCDPVNGCQAGTPLVCDDDNLCNGVETCDAATGCQAGTQATAGTACDDGDVCNGDEVCDGGGTCQAGSPLTCDDGNECNGLETCDPALGCQPGSGTNCPPLEVVFVMDTSGSMQNEGNALCSTISGIVADLGTQGITVAHSVLAIYPNSGNDLFSCQTELDTVHVLLGDAVPNDPDGCPGDLSGNSSSEKDENWGPATAIIADRFAWTPGSTRLIIPVSDEGACLGSSGNGCNDPGSDRDSVENAITVAVANGVIVSPITGDGSSSCVIGLAQRMAMGTGGTAFMSSDPSMDLAAGIANIILAACEAVDTCDDGDACTTDDSCDSGTCQGTPVTCLPDDECHSFACNPATGLCEAVSINEGLACSDDGNVCTDNVCQAGACVAVNNDANSCTDGLACTTDACVSGSCVGTAITCPGDTDCQSFVCNETSGMCEAQSINGGLACTDDGNACTDNVCQGGACVTVNDDSNSCTDGNACTTDVCLAGVCSSSSDGCPADTGCQTFVCNPANGICEAQSINEGLACDADDNPCTDNVCLSGACTVVNDDTNACSDSDACTTDACVSGACVGTAITCPSDTDCQTFVCNGASGLCLPQPKNEGLSCTDDGNACTDNVCTFGVCTAVNDNTNVCSDGINCTTDACVGGSCIATPNICPDATDCQTFACNEATGLCVASSSNEGLSCTEDANPCTDNVCQAGICEAVNDDSNTCTDGNACTNDACVSGVCSSSSVTCPAATDCQTFTCNAANGQCEAQSSNEGLACSDDGNQCTDNVCQMGVCIAVNDNTNACTDNNLCTTDACMGGACMNTPVSCPDATSCQSFACDVADGQCKAQSTNEGLECTSDGNPCTDNTCQAGACVATNDDTNACSDGISCTTDACVAGVCSPTPSDANCDDGSICTTNTCSPLSPQADASGCVSSAVAGCCPLEPCEDNNACTDNVCDGATGSCSFPPIALDCSSFDGDCTVGVCNPANGTCMVQPANEGLACTDDGNACTDDVCRSGTCTPENNDINTCTDNNACTTDDCVAGACVSVAITCPADTDCQTYTCNSLTGQCEAQSTNEGLACTDDGNACTDNVCQAGACVAVNDNTNSCSDGNVCTNDACVGGVCQGTNVSCPADTDCQTFVCNLTTGMCDAQSTNEGLGCTDDGNACTDNVCRAGVCAAENDDTNVCTDSNPCTTDACVAGACTGTSITCPADTDCQTFVCNATTGQCEPQSTNEGLACTDDGNVCTDNVCQSGVCAVVNNDANICTDNNPCTNDACVGGSCSSTNISCPADTDCQTFVCNPGTGVCDAVSTNEGLVCTDDGNPCTDNNCRSGACAAENDDTNTCSDSSLCTADACVAGGCISTAVTCDDSNVCNGVETCDPSLGCQAGTPLSCVDANLCNGTETCDASLGCQAGTPLVCDDNNACSGTETCDPASGCQPGTPLVCNDNDVCNGIETCAPASGCVAGTPLACDDNDACTGVESCDAALGCQAGTSLVCDDSDACNGLETCNPAVGCEAGVPVVCDDNDVCTGVETCDPLTGACIPGTNLDCDDNDLCTVDACDAVQGCLPKTDVDCDDNNVCTGVETCDPLLGCQTGTPLVCDDLNLCTDDACDPIVGCQFIPDDLNSCESDGDLCTQEFCNKGICDTFNQTCPSDTECSSFSCNPNTGDCDEFPISEGLACSDDGNECTADVCRTGLCAHEGTDGAACTDDGIECTEDLCDAAGVCNHTDVIDGTICTQDVLACTLDVCNGGVCEHLGMDAVCDDTVGCTDDVCDLISDCVNTPVDLACDDTVACTIDTCDAVNDCQHTPDDIVCDDGVACTSDVCDEFAGCISSPIDSICDDNVACTIDTCDSVNDCQFTPNSSLCDDGNECTSDQCTATGCIFTNTGLCGACCINSTKSCVSDVLQGTCSNLEGLFIGVGTACLGDMDNDGIDDLCDNCNGANDAIFGQLVCSNTGISCEVDADCDPNDVCQKACLGRIPTVSEWGLLVLTLLLLVCGKLYFGARRSLEPARVG